MPQILAYTYLSTCSWAIVLLFTFYYVMKQYLIPLVYESIKIKNLLANSNTPSTSDSILDTSPTRSGWQGYNYYNNYYNNFLSK